MAKTYGISIHGEPAGYSWSYRVERDGRESIEEIGAAQTFEGALYAAVMEARQHHRQFANDLPMKPTRTELCQMLALAGAFIEGERSVHAGAAEYFQQALIPAPNAEAQELLRERMEQHDERAGSCERVAANIRALLRGE